MAPLYAETRSGQNEAIICKSVTISCTLIAVSPIHDIQSKQDNLTEKWYVISILEKGDWKC